MTGDVSINALANRTAVIVKGSGAGNSGLIDLGNWQPRGQRRQRPNDIDLSINVPITKWRAHKTSAGTLPGHFQ